MNSNLLAAAKKGDTVTVQVLLDKGADANAKDKDSCTALMNAAKKGYSDIVQTLLDKGADVNLQESIYGATALMWASWYGHNAIVQMLLDKSAKVNVKSSYDKTALTGAEKEGYVEIAKLLRKSGQKE